jgi:hypothetical protein
MLLRVVGALAMLWLAGCGSEQPESTDSSRGAPAGATPTAFLSADYCALSKQLDEQMDGHPFDPEHYAAATRTMKRLAEIGPPELTDEWAVLIEANTTYEQAAADAGLEGMSETTMFELFRAQAGEGPWPRGVDRQAVESFDRATAAVRSDASVRQADHSLSDAADRTCERED